MGVAKLQGDKHVQLALHNCSTVCHYALHQMKNDVSSWSLVYFLFPLVLVIVIDKLPCRLVLHVQSICIKA